MHSACTCLDLLASNPPPSPAPPPPGELDGGLTETARELGKLLRSRPAGRTEFVEMAGCGHVPMVSWGGVG
jgi:hypothetical protein